MPSGRWWRKALSEVKTDEGRDEKAAPMIVFFLSIQVGKVKVRVASEGESGAGCS